MWDTTAILSVLTIIWCFPRTGRKCFKARKTALSSRQFMCQERNSPVHSPRAGLPSKTVPQPVIDASVVIIWRRWIAPMLTPLWRKAGSRIVQGAEINCATPWLAEWLVMRGVVSGLSSTRGTASCGATLGATQGRPLPWSLATCGRYSLRHDGLAWSGLDMLWNWKPGQEPNGPASERNPNEPPRTQFAESGREHSSWRSFWGQENECGGERYPCEDSPAPWSEPEWASRPNNSTHECPGTSKGPVQHPYTSWTFSVPRPDRREGPCIGKPSLQRQTKGTSCVAERPACEKKHP